MKKLKNIKGTKALGTQVLVEVLTPQEALNTRLHVTTPQSTPQGFVLDIGNMVPPAYELKVGARIFFSAAAAVMIPGQENLDGRKQFCIDYTSIKGILLEE